MDMASYTTNYGLHQWAASDDFLRTDFNADHLLIDTALAGIQGDVDGKVEVVTGSYTGNKNVQEHTDDPEYQTVSLGFTPKAVVVLQSTFSFELSDYNGFSDLWLVPGAVTDGTDGSTHTKAQIITGGFTVSTYANLNGRTYRYAAFK